MSVYEGKNPYIFISYAHSNQKDAMRVVDALTREGYRIWYDEGITPGSEWPENIAQHLANCGAVIAFITPESMASDNCRREINFALSRKKPLLSVFLEKTELPLGMELQLAAQQSILRYNYHTEEEFLEKIGTADCLKACQGPVPPVPDPGPDPDPIFHDRRILAIAACAIVLIGFVIYRLASHKPEPPEPTVPSVTEPASVPETTEAQETTAETAIPQKLNFMRIAETGNELDRIVKRDGTSEKEQPFWGQTEYRREQVESVRFQGTKDGAPESAWDVSADGDRSVLAWMDGADLHVAADGKIATADASYLFYYFNNLKSIDWGGCFTTSEATAMRSMFNGCIALAELDTHDFDTSKVTNMRCMFDQCASLKELDVSGFDTKAVTNMQFVFRKCSGLTKLDVSGFDTGAVTNMRAMFDRCSGLTELDVHRFITDQVTDMSFMFYQCGDLTELDVSGFDTKKVTDMESMFRECSGLTKLDVSGFDTKAVTNMHCMFYKCGSLKELDVSRFVTDQVTEMDYMFADCGTLTGLEVSGFDTKAVTNMRCMFANCADLKELDVSGFETKSVLNMSYMFLNCGNLTELNVSGFDVSLMEDQSGMFSGCKALPQSAIPSWYTGTV